MKQRLRYVALLIVGLIFGGVTLSGAQMGQEAFIIGASSAAGPCIQVAKPQMTVPVPGGTPTTVSGGALIAYKLHVSNAAATTSFVQLFNLTASPGASATPIGASSWQMPTATDKDINLSDNGVGMAFNVGFEACCSSVQGTYTSAGASSCGFILEYR